MTDYYNTQRINNHVRHIEIYLIENFDTNCLMSSREIYHALLSSLSLQHKVNQLVRDLRNKTQEVYGAGQDQDVDYPSC